MSFATVGAVELFYTDEGAGGPPLLFVHGAACDSHDWGFQLAHFADHHRVIAVDLRGHGRSSAPPDGYGAEELADDLAGLVAQLDCGPVVAVGHSLGGLVVSALAVYHPAAVRALVCVDPAYLAPDERLNLMEAAFAAVQEAPAEAVPSMYKPLDGPATPPYLRVMHLRRAAGMSEHVLRQTMANYTASLRSQSAPLLARRRCPVLTISIHSERISLESALFVDPRSRGVGWPESGHWLHQERPAEFNALVNDWLSGLGDV